MKILAKPLLIILGLVVALVPTGFPETIYARVGAGPGLARRGAAELGLSGNPEYAVVGDELFVREKRAWGSLVFDYSQAWTWDAERIAQLRRRAPELEVHWQEHDAHANRLTGVYR